MCGHFWVHLDFFWTFFRPNLIFHSIALRPRSTLCFWSEKIFVAWKGPKGYYIVLSLMNYMRKELNLNSVPAESLPILWNMNTVDALLQCQWMMVISYLSAFLKGIARFREENLSWCRKNNPRNNWCDFDGFLCWTISDRGIQNFTSYKHRYQFDI